MGRIFDDRSNRMTPSHSNKDGVRYRYYVSHVLLQRREKDAGRVTRVPAIQPGRLVVEAIRAKAQPDTEPAGGLSDRAVIDRYVTRIIVRPDSIDIELRKPAQAHASLPATNTPETAGAAESTTCTTTVISLPWSAPAFHPSREFCIGPRPSRRSKKETRDAILLAVAKARSWIDEVASGCVRSFAEIAAREGKVERHIRLVAPLAFIAPRIGCDHRRHVSARCHRDGTGAGCTSQGTVAPLIKGKRRQSDHVCLLQRREDVFIGNGDVSRKRSRGVPPRLFRRRRRPRA
jgi:site-specific DNA recombinase